MIDRPFDGHARRRKARTEGSGQAAPTKVDGGLRAQAEPAQGESFPVGIVVGFQGIRGEVKVRPETNRPELLLAVRNLLARLPQGDLALKIKSSRIFKKMLLLSFDGLEDRTAVEHLLGASLTTSRREIGSLSPGEFWVSDLVGLEVFTTGGRRVGTIRSIIYGGNDLLEIQGENDPEGKTILVPFVKDLVPVVDTAGGRVEVIDLPGLLEPQ